MLLERPPPFLPTLKGEMDTSYFDDLTTANLATANPARSNAQPPSLQQEQYQAIALRNAQLQRDQAAPRDEAFAGFTFRRKRGGC